MDRSDENESSGEFEFYPPYNRADGRTHYGS